MELILKQETFILDKARALYHPKSKSLIIADVHLGKTTHFRKHGIAVPTNVAKSDLKRLAHLIEIYSPKHIIIAGDFFHASGNSEITLFKDWRIQFPQIEFTLIKGNHDRLKVSDYEHLGLKLEKEILELNGIHITHHPQNQPTQFTICGHLHPGIKIKLRGKQFIKLPSFILQKNQLILPAFSEFTGLDTSLQQTGRSFAITNSQVMEV
ncbi:ligase-associated DNA damage response endonuclease PdeM [Flavobacteriaceae bacterium Ap0902]|nr:ligase-associated DNA damage response endonuclease PdeM [Flavobacteriaceae bacterium Ap0902]